MTMPLKPWRRVSRPKLPPSWRNSCGDGNDDTAQEMQAPHSPADSRYHGPGERRPTIGDPDMALNLSAQRTRRGILIFIVAVAVLAVLFAGVSSFPTMCSSCHAMSPYADALKASSHADVACYSCHLAEGWWSYLGHKETEFFRMYPTALSGEARSGLTGSSSEVARSACTECHHDDIGRLMDTGGLRIFPPACAPSPISCDDCHRTAAHGDTIRWIREPQMDVCVRCHLASSASIECDSCHTGRTETVRLSKGPWAVTHGPEWRTTHGTGDLLLCQTCHPAEKCIRCHGIPIPHPRNFPNSHGQEALREDSECDVCHERSLLCDPCHGLDLPHAEGFLEEHAELVAGIDDPDCVGCHKQSDCLRCHLVHTHPGTTDGNLSSSILPKPKAP